MLVVVLFEIIKRRTIRSLQRSWGRNTYSHTNSAIDIAMIGSTQQAATTKILSIFERSDGLLDEDSLLVDLAIWYSSRYEAIVMRPVVHPSCVLGVKLPGMPSTQGITSKPHSSATR